MQKLKLALVAATLCAGLGIGAASAMPVTKLTTEATAPQVDQVRLVCNRWGHCWHVGGWGGYYHGWGWRHHRGWRW